MKKYTLLFYLLIIGNIGLAQEKMPKFTDEALISPNSLNYSTNKEYKLIIYGALGCSYSRYLIDKLEVFDSCNNMEVIIILNDDKKSILESYHDKANKYRLYSNKILQHKLKKDNDIMPQTFLFKFSEQIFYVKGVKKKMFLNIFKKINCER